jgi:hypothetical protein
LAKKFLVPIDMAKGEIQNLQIQNLGAAPSSPVKGQIYMNTSDNTMYWWDGTTWASARGGGTGFPGFGNVTAQTTFGLTSNNGVGTTASRTDHVHGTPAHDNAAHSAINLSALAVPTAPLNLNGQTIQNLGTPSGASDATTKSYVDNISAGLTWKNPVRIASTANLTLSGLTAIDGVTPVANDRVLAKNQTTQSQNGIYLAASGAWTRATDADTSAELVNAAVFVSEGTANADTAWVQTTNAPITVGTTNIVWVQFAGGGAVTAGAGLTQTGNTLNVGAGTGIAVAADSVALDSAYTDGRYVNVTGDVMDGNLTMGGVAEIFMMAPFASMATPRIAFCGDGQQATPSGWINGDANDGALKIMTGGTYGQNIWLDAPTSVRMKVGAADILSATSGLVTSTKPVALPADPASALHAATKQYVDARANKAFAANVGGATSQAVTHNLNTRDVVVNVYRVAAPYDTVECDVERTDLNNVTLRFTTAPTAAEYRVVVLA